MTDQIKKQTTVPANTADTETGCHCHAEDANKRPKRDAPVKACLPDGCCGFCSPYAKGEFSMVWYIWLLIIEIVLGCKCVFDGENVNLETGKL